MALQVAASSTPLRRRFRSPRKAANAFWKLLPKVPSISPPEKCARSSRTWARTTAAPLAPSTRSFCAGLFTAAGSTAAIVPCSTTAENAKLTQRDIIRKGKGTPKAVVGQASWPVSAPAAQGGAFLENRRSLADRSLTVAALIGVAVTSIGAATVRERFLEQLMPLATLRPQRIELAQRTRACQVFARAHQFRDLPDVSQIVQRPFVQHLRQGDGSHLLVYRFAIAGARRQIAQRFDIGLALFLEMIEGILGIHVAIQLQMLLRVVTFELRVLFAQEPVQAGAVAMSLAVAQVREHLAHREPAGRGLPADVLGGELSHQAAQNRRRGFQQIEAGQSVVFHRIHPTMFSPPST